MISAFRVEDYLDQCLNSVLPAMAVGDELILVMRNKSDPSYGIARRHAERCDAVQVVLQDGTGLSNARNCGLDLASGDYVLFLDGDDFVRSGALSQVLRSLRGGRCSADVVMTDFLIFQAESGRCQVVQQVGPRSFSGLQGLARAVRRRRSFWNVWRYLFRTAFLKTNHLRFQEHTHGEDVDFMARVFLCEPEILFTGPPFYCYRRDRAGSLMNTCSLARVEETERILRHTAILLQQSGRLWASPLVACVQWEYILNLALIQELPASLRQDGRRAFHCYRQVLLPPESMTLGILAAGINLFGLDVVSRLMIQMKRWKHKVQGRNTEQGGRRRECQE